MANIVFEFKFRWLRWKIRRSEKKLMKSLSKLNELLKFKEILNGTP
jgi:hypothetical protein